MSRLFYLLTGLLITATAAAQLPNTQVYAFDFRVQDTTVQLSNPVYLTSFNQRGYNNQPSWIDRNRLLMSVQTTGQDQPDIYSFDLAAKTKTRLTATTAGEYSPKAIGGTQRFSAIRQEYVGRDTVLRLWEFPMSLRDNGKPVFSSANGIGYYEWLNSVQLALYLVQSPSQLVLATTDADAKQPLAQQTGRCFKRQPNGNLAYVDKSTTPYRIMEKNLYRLDEAPNFVTDALEMTEDFAILNDGSYLMARGSQLFRYDAIRTPRWVQVADLRLYGIRNITRIDVSGFGRLALVADGTLR
ncbi:hypothetical protein [Neolewinella antarctica]|uniref:Esterase-like activity of phytase family protein n=1 Tax=Neolewinella antarctica TaxID=442734 RepID=A0ABX0X6U6_9BACT|nr:hypothetical protein [Neolewinella antarctica]NJC24587.1 hypothetical protein [Neolewinella antarctica]